MMYYVDFEVEDQADLSAHINAESPEEALQIWNKEIAPKFHEGMVGRMGPRPRGRISMVGNIFLVPDDAGPGIVDMGEGSQFYV